MEEVNMIQGPLLDALSNIKDIIWWNGFWWGCLAGFFSGIIFQAILGKRE